MPQDETQTAQSAGVPNLEEVTSFLDNLDTHKATIQNHPDKVFEDSGVVDFLKEVNPKYSGHNSASLRANLIEDEELLDEFATKIIANTTSVNDELSELYQTNPEAQKDHKQAVKDELFFNLTNDVVQGDSPKKSIVDRTLEVRNSDLSDFKSNDDSPTGEYDSLIDQEARRNGYDPDLLRALIMQESGGDPEAISEKGAMGLGQLMPDTAKDLGVQDPNDPEQNIRGSAEYLGQQLDRYGDVPMALAAYNAGPNQDSLQEGKLPNFEETQNYIPSVIGNYEELKNSQQKIKYDIPVSDYRRIAESNPDKYRGFGIVDSEGNFKFDGEDGLKAFTTKIRNDDELHAEIESERYDEFLDKLSTSHNSGAIDESDVNDQAKAWAIYDQFGSEGLTQFLNLKEHYTEGLSIEDQPNQVQEAFKYLDSVNKNGLTPTGYIEAFFGSEDHEIGSFSHVPITESAEIHEDVPQDLNNYTRWFNPENGDEGFDTFLDDLRAGQTESEGGFWDKAADFFTEVSENFFPGAKRLEYNEETGESLTEEEQEKRYLEATAEEVKYDLDNGLDTYLSRNVKFDVVAEATSEEGNFSVEDLTRTIMANADDYTEEDNRPLYTVNYEEADFKTRLAIDAIRSDDQLRSLTYTDTNGNIVLDPSYQEKIKDKKFYKFLTRDKGAKVRVGEDGQHEVLEEPDSYTPGEEIGRFLGVTGFSLAKFLDNRLVRPAFEKALIPMAEGLNDTIETLTGSESEFFEGLPNDLERWERTGREELALGDELIGDLPFDGPGDIFSSASPWIVELGAYMGLASKLGRSQLQAPGKMLEQMAKARNATSNTTAGMFLGHTSNQRFKSMARKAQRAAKDNERWLSYGKYALGSVPIEFTSGDQYSIFGTGIVDAALNKAKDGLGDDVNLEKKYQMSNRFVQTGLDVMAIEGAGLVFDNLIGVAAGLTQMARGRPRTGYKFKRGENDFEKIESGLEMLTASDSRRFAHNMFNGLQDVPVGNIAESLKNTLSGRGFLAAPENAETLADGVVGFTDKAGYIFSDAKKIIRDNIEYYDKEFGGSMRYSADEIDQRVDELYNEFMDKSAKTIKEGLENTSDSEVLPLRIANLLDQAAPRVKGTIPYHKDGKDFHLMTKAEANELAASNPKYVAKPYQGSDKFYRVFEVDDGLWNMELANRMRNLYKEETAADVINRQKKRAGLPTSVGLNKSQQEQAEAIEDGVNTAFGREVEVDGNRGYIVDFDEDGFVVRDVNDNYHRGVSVQGLDDVYENVTGKSQFYEELDLNTTTGKEAKATASTKEISDEEYDQFVKNNEVSDERLNSITAKVRDGEELTDREMAIFDERIDEIEELLTREKASVEANGKLNAFEYEGLTIRGRNSLTEIDEQGIPNEMTDNLRAAAKENGIEVTENSTPASVVNKLRSKGLDPKTKKALDKVQEADKIIKDFKNSNGVEVSKGVSVSKTFSKTGLGESFMKHLNKFAGYARLSKNTARKFAKMLGVDNTNGYKTFGKNLKGVTEFNPKKVGDKGLKANTVVKRKDQNGVNEHFINTRKVKGEDSPSVWVHDTNGGLMFNPKWRRIGVNETLDDDGTLPLFTRVEKDGEVLYRRAEPGEEGVMLNVQKSSTKELSDDELIASGVDATRKEIDGQAHYKLVNEGQQTIDPNKLKERTSKIYNASSTTTKNITNEMEKETTNLIAENLKQSGLGSSVALGLAGAIVDNILGIAPGGEDGFGVGLFGVAGALLGSRRVRTSVNKLVNGFESKPVKDVFDNSASSQIKTERALKKKKEAAHYGVDIDPFNEKEVRQWEQVKDTIKNAREGTQIGWNTFRRNKFFTSKFSFLKNLGSPTGLKFLKALQTMNLTLNRIGSQPVRRFYGNIEALKGEISPERYNRLMGQQTRDPYQVFSEEGGPELIKRFFPDREIKDQAARENFNLAFNRIQHTGAELVDGEIVSTPNPTVTRQYESPVGDLYREMDRKLLEDPVFNAFKDAHRDWFSNVKDQWMEQIDLRIERLFASTYKELDKKMGESFREMLSSKQSYGLWKGTLSDNEQRTIQALRKNNEAIDRMIELHNTKTKFTDLDRNYLPQITSVERTRVAFREFIDANPSMKIKNADGEEISLKNATKDQQKEAFDKHMTQRTYEMNMDPKSRKQLQKYDPESGQYGLKFYDSRSKARSELNQMSNYLLAKNDKKLREIGRRMQESPDDFIRTKKEPVLKNGEPVLDVNGDTRMITKRFLEQPDELDVNVFEIPMDNFKTNISSYRGYYDDLINNDLVRNSNFLERPRINNLPHEILEIDPQALKNKYTMDVGKRLHNAKNDMFDMMELKANYLDDVVAEASSKGHSPQAVQRDLVNLYNSMNNIINKTGSELQREVKFRQQVDLFKRGLFSVFGYGFGNYNMFEWAVVGPMISSFSQVGKAFKGFLTDKQELENAEKFMHMMGILRKEIGAVNPDFEKYGLLAGDDLLNFASNKVNKGANTVANFSFTKTIGGKAFGYDVENWGLGRLLTDSFMGSNSVSSTINAKAALGDAHYYSSIARKLRQLPEDGPKVVEHKGKRYTEGDVNRKLEQLGVTEDIRDRFIQNADNVEGFFKNDNFDIGTILRDEMPDHVDDIFRIMQTATENFHGTNKMYRPEGWDGPMGQALSTYSTYPFNFALQNVQRRIRQPMKEWQNQYGEQLKGGAGKVNMMKVLHNLSKGNTQALRNMGLNNEAISNIPIDAYQSILKLMGSTMGVSVAGYMTIDAMNDVVSYPLKEVTGQEQWTRLKGRNVLNPGAPKEDQITWSNIDEDFGLDTFMTMVHHVLGLSARSGTFGRYGDIISQNQSLARQGVLSLTPMTGIADQTLRDLFSVTTKPVTETPKEMTNFTQKFFINNTPILGGNTFGELRKGIYEQVRLKNPDMKIQNSETGQGIKVEDLRTELE